MSYMNKKAEYPNRYKPSNSRNAQAIICEFMNSELPIMRVDWEKWGYSSSQTCKTCLHKSIQSYSEPVFLITRKKQVYLIDCALIDDI